MGSAATNFYNNAFERQGYGDDVRDVQRLWLAGDKDAARERVPTAIGLGTNLIGTDDLVRDRLRLYRDAGITTLRANLHGDTSRDLDRATHQGVYARSSRVTARPNVGQPDRSIGPSLATTGMESVSQMAQDRMLLEQNEYRSIMRRCGEFEVPIVLPQTRVGTSNSKPHWNHRVARVPLIPKFASRGCCKHLRTSESGP